MRLSNDGLSLMAYPDIPYMNAREARGAGTRRGLRDEVILNRTHRHVEASSNGSLRAQLDLGIELFSLGSARIGHAVLSRSELHLGRLGSMGRIRLSLLAAAELISARSLIRLFDDVSVGVS
jgi:hypothetical protein